MALARATLGDLDHAREVLERTRTDSAADSDYLFAKFFFAVLETMSTRRKS
jgi:hypothetical protein